MFRKKEEDADYKYRADRDVPLIVDLDGTLIRSNLFIESILFLMKKYPSYIFSIPWLVLFFIFSRRFKLFIKGYVAKKVESEIDVKRIPYQLDFIFWLRKEKSRGRKIWLCTGSRIELASKVAQHLGIFEGVMSSDDSVYLVGREKASALKKKFGSFGFDYAGNSKDDLDVWKWSRKSIFVNAADSTFRKSINQTDSKRFGQQASIFTQAWRAIRPHQWVKNMLVFVPLIAAHKWDDMGRLLESVMAFLAFSLCASSVYLCNDLFDLNADRQHPEKQGRPLASGAMSLEQGGVISAVFLGLCVLASCWIGAAFLTCMACYWCLTMAYSLKIKQALILDVVTLALLYTSRLMAGSIACDIELSFWLILFSIFFFLGLALVKRYAEVDKMHRSHLFDASGRAYRSDDLPLIQCAGLACGMLSVLVLGLYINAPDVTKLYSHPQAIWAICLLLMYWILRVWLITHRGEMAMDPVVFALKDRISQAIAGLGVITLAMAV